jgi:hypothetical protein
VAYAGNLGRAHYLATILETMTLLHQRAGGPSADDVARRIMFLFIGGGAQRATLEQEVRKRGLTNVQFHPYQPQERLAETLGVADLHLVSLNPNLEGLMFRQIHIRIACRPTIFISAVMARSLGSSSKRHGFTVALAMQR